MSNRIVFFILILLFSSEIVHAVSPHYYYKQIALNEGLSQSTVHCIQRDHAGQIWIGTKAGLNSYDGYELKKYFYNEQDAFSLPDNDIWFIAEDSLQTLWVGTAGGMAFLDRSTNRFVRQKMEGAPMMVRSFLQVEGGVLFGGEKELYKYEYKNRRFRRLPVQCSQEIPGTLRNLYAWKQDTLLVNIPRQGIWTYDLRNGKLQPSAFDAGPSITCLYIDRRGRVWLSPEGEGLRGYSANGKLFYTYTTANSDLSNDVILDLIEKDGNLWIGTDGGGINLLDMNTGQLSTIRYIPGDIYSLPVNTINCFYNDWLDNLWIGSVRGGVFGLKEIYIRTFKDAPLNTPYGLSDKTVLCLQEDKAGIIWIGTDGGGINSYDPETSRFTHYPGLFNEKVVSIVEYTENEFLISLYRRGIFVFNKYSGKIRPFEVMDKDVSHRIRTSASVTNLVRIGNSIYLLADHIYCYDIRTKTFQALAEKEGYNYHSLLPFSPGKTLISLAGRHTLFNLNYATNHIEPIYNSPNAILCAIRDKEGHYWIGTNAGLVKYQPLTGQLQPIGAQLFNAVSSLVLDHEGRLWIGADNMLFTYIIAENRFVNREESDGVAPNEFLAKPTLLSRSGDIYMGGAAGLIRIDKDIPLDEENQPVLTFTEILLNGVPAMDRYNKKRNKLTIPWNHSSLQIKAAVLEKEFFRMKRFRYHLEGLNSRKMELYDHIFSIGILPPGNYILCAQSNTKNGSWNTPVSIMNIEVTPPFWTTAWFVVTCILAAIGMVFGFVIFYTHKKEDLLKWKMKEHEQKIYEDKVRFLINISHELRTPLTLIYAPLKRLIDGTSGSPELKKQLSGVYKQARQMKNIINMVLDIRRMEVGKETLFLQPHLLNPWVQSMAEDFRNELEARNIRLSVWLDPTLESISFDKNKCEIVLSNFLSNALKFSLPDTEVLVRTIRNGAFARIEVSDEGIGLKNVHIQHLFERFYQGEHTQDGSGIGLSYAKLLVEMHGGTIGAMENEKHGATFFFELPLAAQTQQIRLESKPYINELFRKPTSEAPPTSDYPTSGLAALVVDDDPELLNFLKESLEGSFKKVYAAADGRQAMKILAEAHPDIVISDVMMPHINGYELCHRIKEDLEISHIPVILLTARNDEESTLLGYKTGADAYISKPFEVEFLQAVLCNLLRNRESVRQRYLHSAGPLPPRETTFSHADEQFLLKFETILSEYLSDEKLDIQLLTQRMAVSRSTLYSKIKAISGLGVNDYINKYRMKAAMQLLRETQLPISEISERTGFSNQRYFSTLFKQMQGVTPSAYRQANRTAQA